MVSVAYINMYSKKEIKENEKQACVTNQNGFTLYIEIGFELFYEQHLVSEVIYDIH